MDPSGKRVIAFISVARLESLNNPEINYAFLDGTFKIKPKYMNQDWILRAFIGDSTIALTYAYFLLESSRFLHPRSFHHQNCSTPGLFNPPNFMVDFESGEHRAIRNCYPNATIHGCLFHLKQAIIRHFTTVLPTFATDTVLRSDFCAVFGLAFVPVADIDHCWTILKNHLTTLLPLPPPSSTILSQPGSTLLSIPETCGPCTSLF